MTLPGCERLTVLITVKTYPNSSQRHEEAVCTAGVTADAQWIRLYPINFRRLDKKLQFKKYQWVSVDVHPKGNAGDRRPESRKPELHTLELRDFVPSSDGWRARRELIDRLPHRTLKECQDAYNRDRTSLSVVVPSEIIDLKVTPNDDKKWNTKFQSDYEQIDLFGEKPLKLERLPYKFQYVFRCKDDDKPHTIMIEDWEVGQLFLKMRDQHESEDTAVKMVRRKFLEELCSPEKDTRFFMGTHSRWETWLVIGVFYPPKDPQLELF